MNIPKWASYTEQFCNVGYHEWSVARLIELSRDLPVMEIPVNHLYTWYEKKFDNLRDLASYIRAVNDADLSYPIILDEDGVVMDGRHRIVKALVEGRETIKAVRFEENPPPCRVKEGT